MCVVNIFMRKLCKKCGSNPVAVNYKKDNRVYYRSVCDGCAKNRRPRKPAWWISGYRIKNRCDRCGFASGYSQQFSVFYVDGNLNNCRHDNLKTVCANCQRILQDVGITWRRGDLTPDF